MSVQKMVSTMPRKIFEMKLTNRKGQLFCLALEELDSRINEGMRFTLTEIREYMFSLGKDPELLIFYNQVAK